MMMMDMNLTDCGKSRNFDPNDLALLLWWQRLAANGRPVPQCRLDQLEALHAAAGVSTSEAKFGAAW